MDDPKKGFYLKFTVNRVDGRDRKIGDKHYACDYLVLDFQHDPFAVPAIRAYAAACENEYPALAADLRLQADQLQAMWDTPPCDNCDGDGLIDVNRGYGQPPDRDICPECKGSCRTAWSTAGPG